MLKWAAVLAIVALVLAVLGSGGLAGSAGGVAKIQLWFAVVVAVALAVLGLTIHKKLA